MQEKVNRITSLIEKFLVEKRLNAEEEMELNAWLAEAEHNDAFFKQITNKNELREKLKFYAMANSETIWQKTVQKINGGAKLIDLYPEKKTVRLPWGKIAAAAVGLLFVLACTWYFTNQNQMRKASNQPVATTESNNSSKKSSIVPGSSKATLTLADGATIALNAAQKGNLADQGHIQITKTDERLIYNKKPDSDGSVSGTDLYNTVTTPRGGEYKITLSDGSKVWLNAASSLRFPIAFAGNERIVELTGEAYFEVNPLVQPGTKQKKGQITKTPFIVKINTPTGNRNEVEVLGTHFNVMAYTEEGAIRTTLVEGKVKVTSGNSYQTIGPGEQAKLGAGNISVHNVDAGDVIGWTKGFIPVGGHDLDYTMRQIARWYDVNIVYQGKKPEISFDGKLPRSASIDNIIKLLLVNKINARLNEKERTIIVSS